MRASVLALALFFPLLASSQPKRQQIQSGSLTITTFTEESIGQVGVPDVEVFLRGISAGTTTDQGAIPLRGFQTTPSTPTASLPSGVLDGIPLLPGPLRGTDLYAAYAPPNETDGGTVVLLDSPDELAFMLGDRPHAMLDGPVDWSCSGVAFTYDASTSTLDAEPSGCSEPSILEINCPVSLRAGETGAFEARLSGSYDVPVEWSVRDADGADLDVEYVTDETEMDTSPRPSPVDQLTEIDRMAIRVLGPIRFSPGRSEAIVSASLGDDMEESCPVGFENDPGGLAAYESILYDRTPSARVTLGYNVEFGSVSVKVGANAPIPVGVPLYGDLSVGYYSDGDVGYGLLHAEVQSRAELSPLLALFYGGGLHLLRSSNNGNSSIELGPGVSGRVQYDGGWPVEPTVELNVSYHYETVIPTLSVGAAYRFNR